MRIELCAALVGFGITTLSGCATFGPPPGLLFSEMTVPHSSTVAEITGGPKPGDRMGEACIENYLMLIALGDASVDTAKKAGGVTIVSSVETSAFSVLGLYTRYCTQVWGQ